jgi:hypothetical protein
MRESSYVCVCVQAVSESAGSFKNRRDMPAAWRGLRDAKLSEVSGIPGCVFVHTGGFIGGEVGRSRESLPKGLVGLPGYVWGCAVEMTVTNGKALSQPCCRSVLLCLAFPSPPLADVGNDTWEGVLEMARKSLVLE